VVTGADEVDVEEVWVEEEVVEIDEVEVEEWEVDEEEELPLEGPEGALPALGPAMEVVMGPSSTKMPDQYQSSAAASVPPLGRRSSPICQSAELVEQDALIVGMT